MPLYKTIPLEAGLLGIWKLTEKSTELLASFSSGEINDSEYKKYNYEKRKSEYLATRLLIKQLIGTDFEISYQNSGKPLLKHSKYKHIAISHSRDFAAVYLHENLEIGIDIECIDRNYTAVEKKYLSADEIIQVNNNVLLQCLYWCTKEAIFKLVPEDGIEFREQILISPFNPEVESSFKVLFQASQKLEWYEPHFQIFENNCLVWVSGLSEKGN